MWDTSEQWEKYTKLGMEYLKGKKSLGRMNIFTAKLALHQFVGGVLLT
jgi:hypothetical protein